MVTRLVYGGVAVAGAVGGFALDRSIADTPYRVDKRVPDIARAEEQRDYYSQREPAPAGGGVNAAVLWGPIGGSVVAAIGVATTMAMVPKDRIWQHTLVGRGAIGATIVGASMATGALISRAVLG